MGGALPDQLEDCENARLMQFRRAFGDKPPVYTKGETS